MDKDPAWPVAAGEMAQRVREHDWAATPLGSSGQWPVSLRTTVQTLLAHPLPTIVLWGRKLIQIYNDAYRDLMGVKHPAGLGQPTHECWLEVWHLNAPIYERVWQGESVSLEDALFPITRSGQLEDAWFSLTYSPVRDESGGVAGVFLTIIETTRRLRAEAALCQSQARQAFLLRLSDALRPLQDAQAIKRQATRLLGEQLAVNRVFYAEVESDDWMVVKGYEQGVAPLPEGSYAAQTYGPWIMDTYRAGRRLVVHDTRSDPLFTSTQRQAHAAVQILGAVGVPLVKQGTLVAVLAVHSAAPRHWTEEEVALVEETAERTWAAVERARAEAAQRQSEQRLTAVFEALPVGVGLVDTQGALLLANPEMRRFMPEGVIPSCDEGRHGRWRAYHPDGRRIERQHYPGARALRGERVLPGVEFLFLHDDGTETWTRVAAVPIIDGEGRITGAIGVAADIDAAKRAEQTLRESEERLRLAMEAGELATWDWNLHTGRVVWSQRHYRMEDYAAGELELSYEAWMARVHPQDRAGTEAALEAARQRRRPYDHEFRTVHPDGSVHWMSAQGHFFYDEQGRAVRMIGVTHDVTEQRSARELLEQRVKERTRQLEQAGELRRQLLARMESVQDDERRRIARELHDSLGQFLSAMALSVMAFGQHVSSAAAVEQLKRLQQLLEAVDQELDRIVFTLRPTALEDCGLSDAIAAYVATWSQLSKQPVDLLLQGLEGRRLPPRVEAAVFRVIQEALNNIAKHAQASSVSVSVERLGRQLVASVEDDGAGFDTADDAPLAAGRPSWGLLGMKERIEAVAGTLVIESRQGQGTTILMRVPLH